MTDDQRKAEGLKRLAKDIDKVSGGETMVTDAIRTIEREAWLQGFEFCLEMDKAIHEIARVIDPC